MKNKFYAVILTVLLFIGLEGGVYSQGKIPPDKIDSLRSVLDMICQPINSSGIKISCKVVHADFNKTLYELNPDEPMIPASITKLITSAAAFSKMGSNYRIETKVFTDDSDVNDG